MKRVLLILMAFVIATSCSSELERGINACIGRPVKVIDVKAANVPSRFGYFTPECATIRKDISAVRDSIHDIDLKIELASIRLRSHDWRLLDSLIKVIDNYKAAEVPFKDEEKRLNSLIDSVETNPNSGSLYIAKLRFKDDFGKWCQNDEYKAFIKDKDGIIIEVPEDADYYYYLPTLYPETAEWVHKLHEEAKETLDTILNK